MNRIWRFLRSLDWRVLLALPVLSLLLGVANNLRVPAKQQVKWSGKRLEEVKIAEVAVPEATPGMWTTNFVAATNAAEAAHLPVVVFALSQGCPSCVHFHEEVQSDEVKAWQKGLGWYFVMTDSKAALDFVKATPVRNTKMKPPYVGVYWTRADGTCAMRNFTARSGHMGVPAESSLAQEWMRAVEASVPGAPGTSSATRQNAGVQISVKSENVMMGRVKMSPKVNVILPGQHVVLTAMPKKGMAFAGWRYPDGRLVQGEPQLTLDDTCQAGTYEAVFRSRQGKGRGLVLRRDKEGN